jgi:hypothetical protein
MKTCVLNPVLGTVLTTAAVYLSHFYGVAAPEFSVKPGKGFVLDARGSTDPDGDSLSYLWFNCPEAGSFKSPIEIDSGKNASDVYIKAPDVERKETAHFNLKVIDEGKPPLTRYKHVTMTILPNELCCNCSGKSLKGQAYAQSCTTIR